VSVKRVLVVAVAAAVLAGFFRVHRPWLKAGLWGDETVSVWIGSAPTLHTYLDRYARMDSSPPIYAGIVGLWGRAFGFDEASLSRLTATIAGAALLCCGWAGARISGCWAGILAMLFLASNDILFWQFDQLRPYALSVACEGAVVALFATRWRLRSTGGRQRVDLAFAASCAALAWSHYPGTLCIVMLGATALALSLRSDADRFWRWTAIACALPGVPLLAWLPTLVRQVRVGLPWDPLHSLSSRLSNLVVFAGTFPPRIGPHPAWWSGAPLVLGIVLAVPVAGRLRTDLAQRQGGLLLAAGFGLGVFLIFGLKWGVSRYVSLAAAAFAIVAACLSTALWRAWRVFGVPPRWGVIAGCILGAGVAAGEAYRYTASGIADRAPARTGVRALVASLSVTPDDLVVTAPNYLATTFWYYGVRPPVLHGYPQWDEPQDVDYSRFSEIWTNPASPEECVRRVITFANVARSQRIVLVSDLNPSPAVRSSVRRITEGLDGRYGAPAQGVFHGYPETVVVRVFRAKTSK
jgi:hypothetical protein